MVRISSAPSKFSILDGVIVAVYAAFVVGPGLSLLPLRQWLQGVALPPAVLVLLLNLTLMGVAAVLAAIAARSELVRGWRLIRKHVGVSIAVIFLAQVVAYLLTLAAVLIIQRLQSGASIQESVNQQEIQALVSGNTLALSVPLLVVVGPFLEEYLFRHLLIGKLSRYINVWICAVVSVAAFALLHVVGKEAPTWLVLAPYLAIGVVLAMAYIQREKNLLISYAIHAVHNLLALLAMLVLAGISK